VGAAGISMAPNATKDRQTATGKDTREARKEQNFISSLLNSVLQTVNFARLEDLEAAFGFAALFLHLINVQAKLCGRQE